MKVGIIDHVGRKAGMDYYTSALAEGMAENDVEVLVYSNFDDHSASYRIFNTFPFFIKNPIARFYKILKGFLVAIYSMKRHGVHDAVVHLFSADLYYVFLLLLIKLSGCRLILINHDSQSFAGAESSRLRRFTYNFLASKVVVHNEYSLKATLPLIKNGKKVSCIKHGSFEGLVNDVVSREDARRKYNLKKEDFFAVFFGQIKKVKRLDVFLSAIECNKNIKYHVAGRVWKDDFSKYQRIVDRKKSECLTLDIGYVSDLERENLFKAADSIILPYDEVYQSGVLLMAMSYGVCPIVSDIPAFREIIIDRENGLLFEQGNSNSLASKISELAKNPKLKQKLSERSKLYVEAEFSWNKIAKEYVDKVLR